MSEVLVYKEGIDIRITSSLLGYRMTLFSVKEVQDVLR